MGNVPHFNSNYKLCHRNMNLTFLGHFLDKSLVNKPNSLKAVTFFSVQSLEGLQALKTSIVLGPGWCTDVTLWVISMKL